MYMYMYMYARSPYLSAPRLQVLHVHTHEEMSCCALPILPHHSLYACKHSPGWKPRCPPPTLSPAAPLAPGRNVKRKPPMLANLIWGGTVLHTQFPFEINFKGGEGIEKRFNVRMGWSVWYTVKYK